MTNMGTPEHPEGLKHWTVKSMMVKKLRAALGSTPRGYGQLFAGDLRNVQVPTEIAEPILMRSLDRVRDRVTPRDMYSYVAYEEQSHGGCDGGIMLVNLLADMCSGRVEVEKPFAGYVPDIALYAEGADTPSCIIEVVATSEPSPAKVAEMKRRGVTMYSLRADKPPNLVFHEPVVVVEVLAHPVCGKKLRGESHRLNQEWGTWASPFIGIRNYPSGVQQYIVGESRDEDTSWGIGDIEVYGLAPFDDTLAWASVPMIRPGHTRSLAKDTWMFMLMWMRCAALQIACDTSKGNLDRRLARRNIRYIDDLLTMVRLPCD